MGPTQKHAGCAGQDSVLRGEERCLASLLPEENIEDEKVNFTVCSIIAVFSCLLFSSGKGSSVQGVCIQFMLQYLAS